MSTHHYPFQSILVHWFLECQHHSCHLLFDHFQFALIHGPDIPGSYAILDFTASGLASITSPIHNWVLFLLWLHPFILSGVISPLISSSILGPYWPGEFLFQYSIVLPFNTVHGVLKARILKWFAIPFSSGPHSVILSYILAILICLGISSFLKIQSIYFIYIIIISKNKKPLYLATKGWSISFYRWFSCLKSTIHIIYHSLSCQTNFLKSCFHLKIICNGFLLSCTWKSIFY